MERRQWCEQVARVSHTVLAIMEKITRWQLSAWRHHRRPSNNSQATLQTLLLCSILSPWCPVSLSHHLSSTSVSQSQTWLEWDYVRTQFCDPDSNRSISVSVFPTRCHPQFMPHCHGHCLKHSRWVEWKSENIDDKKDVCYDFSNEEQSKTT